MEHEIRPQRRHRPLLGISGVTLFVCLFLPALRVCGHDDTPLEYPFVWAPYFYGLAFVGCAFLGVARRGKLVAAVTIVRALTILFIVGSFVLGGMCPPLGLAELVLATLILVTLGGGVRESRLALSAIVVGGMSAIWFLSMSTSPDALYGLRLSLGASIGVLLSGVIWRRDIALDLPVRGVPRAIARERDVS